MDAIEFVSHYPTYLAQLSKVVKPEYQPVIRKMKKIDPHDVVKPEHYFSSEAEAVGVVFRLFLKKAKDEIPKKLSKEDRQLIVDRKIEAAKKLLAANGIQSQGLWSVDDIIEIARENKILCSNKDARTLLAKIQDDYNAEVGITWQSVEQCVQDHFRDGEPK
jgi:hypothetical protein